ncbi:MAG TPA: superoxide dismutase, partial [Methylophaga aminisulfidivorans]|nr:superoxide dismutase [Methylophaga aminisulfidivorans]
MKLKYAFLVSILLSSASFAADDITVDMTNL